MAQIANYAALLPYVVPRLAGIETNRASQVLKATGRQFCIDTEAWHDDLNPIAIVDYQRDYTLSHSYSATIQRILKVECNAVEWNALTYELRTETVLRFNSASVPHDLDSTMLTCGTCGETTAANWTSVTDGAVTVSIGGNTYDLESLTFAGVSTMADVALVIQTGMRAEMDSNTGYVQYVTDHFVLWADSAEVSYVTAGASGTDISGASYMNGLTGTGSLSPILEAEVVFRPELTADDLPDWFMDRWSEAIIDGTLGALMLEEKKPWSNAQLGLRHQHLYNTTVTRAKSENVRDFRHLTPAFSA